MNDKEIRLACLQAAAEHCPFRVENVLPVADSYYQWVQGNLGDEAKNIIDAALGLSSAPKRPQK